MIIRRKPVGFDSLRKPQSLGMSLLRNGIARAQALTIRRVPQSDEPINWGDGIPDDSHSDGTAEQVGYADYEVVDTADTNGQSFAQTDQAASTPRTAARSTGGQRQSVQRQSVQRQPAQHQAVQRQAAPPQPQADVKSTTAPDLRAIMAGHRAAGHVKDDASKHALTKTQGIFDKGSAATGSGTGPSSAATTEQSAGSADASVQRSTDNDDVPRPRRRSRFTDLTPPKKGLPFGDDAADIGPDALGSENENMGWPIGAPAQRTTSAANREEVSQPPAATSSGSVQRIAEPSAEQLTTPTPSDDRSYDATDMSATALDLDVSSLRAPSSQNASSNNSTENVVPANYRSERPVDPPVQRLPAMSDYSSPTALPRSETRSSSQGAEPAATFESGDYDEPDDESEPARPSFNQAFDAPVQRTFVENFVENTESFESEAATESQFADSAADFPTLIDSSPTLPTRASTSEVQRQANVPDRPDSPRSRASTTPSQASAQPSPQSSSVQRAASHTEAYSESDFSESTQFTDFDDADSLQDAAASFTGAPIQNSGADAAQDTLSSPVQRTFEATPSDIDADIDANNIDLTTSSTVTSERSPQTSSRRTPSDDTNVVSGARQDALSRAIAHAERPSTSVQRTPDITESETYNDEGDSDTAFLEDDSRTDRNDTVDFQAQRAAPATSPVQRTPETTLSDAASRSDDESSFAAPDTSVDTRQDALSRAIARAESRTASDAPIQRIPASEASSDVNDYADNADYGAEPSASFTDAPADSYQASLSKAVARAGSRITPDAPVQRTPDTSFDTSDNTEFADYDVESTESSAEATTATSSESYQDALSNTIGRTESRTTSESPVRRTSDMSFDTSEYAADHVEAAASFTEVDTFSESYSDAPSRPSAEAAVQRMPGTSISENETTSDSYQDALSRAIARAESHPTANAPVQRTPSFDAEFEDSALDIDPVATFADTDTSFDTGQHATPHAGNRRTAKDSVQRTPSVEQSRDAASVEDESASFSAPYAPDDPHYSAFQQALARVEGRTAPSVSSDSVQRMPAGAFSDDMQDEAVTEDAGGTQEHSIDIVTALQRMGALPVQMQRDTSPADLMPPIGEPQRAIAPLAPSAGRGNSGYTTPAQPSIQRSPDDTDSQVATSTEADLLRLLGMPTDTPITRGSQTPLPSLSSSDQASTPGQSGSQDSVQRVINTDQNASAPAQQAPGSSANSSNDNTSSADDSAEVEKMAQAVYRILRQRLKVERERSQGRVR